LTFSQEVVLKGLQILWIAKSVTWKKKFDQSLEQL
jgi:hypothetical protein